MFLHGGPGFTAELERRKYGTTLPVHWWDQPHIAANALKPFDTLVEAAKIEARRTFNSDERTRIVSFINTYASWVGLDWVMKVRTLTGGYDLITIESSQQTDIVFRVKEKAAPTRPSAESR